MYDAATVASESGLDASGPHEQGADHPSGDISLPTSTSAAARARALAGMALGVGMIGVIGLWPSTITISRF